MDARSVLVCTSSTRSSEAVFVRPFPRDVCSEVAAWRLSERVQAAEAASQIPWVLFGLDMAVSVHVYV